MVRAAEEEQNVNAGLGDEGATNNDNKNSGNCHVLMNIFQI